MPELAGLQSNDLWQISLSVGNLIGIITEPISLINESNSNWYPGV